MNPSSTPLPSERLRIVVTSVAQNVSRWHPSIRVTAPDSIPFVSVRPETHRTSVWVGLVLDMNASVPVNEEQSPSRRKVKLVEKELEP